MCAILDLKAQNDLIWVPKFCIKSTRTVKASPLGDFLAFVDSKDNACLHIFPCISGSFALMWVPSTSSLWPCHSPLLLLSEWPQLYWPLCLPCYTPRPSPLWDIWKTSCWGISRHKFCLIKTAWTVQSLQRFGCIINLQKFILVLSPVLDQARVILS